MTTGFPSGGGPVGDPRTAVPPTAPEWVLQHGGVRVAAPHTVPEYWLDAGPALPQRTWQRSTRTTVIVVSVLGAILLGAVALTALVAGAINSTQFTAKGEVVVDCASGAARAPGGAIGVGDDVVVYDETGDRLGSGKLRGLQKSEGTCHLPFEIGGVRAGAGSYVVHVGAGFQQTVGQQALATGAVLRPVG